MSKVQFVLAAFIALTTTFAQASGATLVKNGTYTRDQFRLKSDIVSTGFTCERGYDQPVDQAGDIAFNPDHCKDTGYDCAITVAAPFNDGVGMPVNISIVRFNGNGMSEAVCNQKIKDVYNSLGAAPLHYSIYRLNDTTRKIRIQGLSEAEYYFYSKK